MTSLQKQTSSTTFVNDNNDLTKLKSSLSQRAMARRSVCLNSALLSSTFAQEGSKEEPINVSSSSKIKSPLKDKEKDKDKDKDNSNNGNGNHPPSKIPDRPSIKPGFRTNTTSSSLKSNNTTSTTTTTTTTTSSTSTTTTTNNGNNSLNFNNVLSSSGSNNSTKRSNTLRNPITLSSSSSGGSGTAGGGGDEIQIKHTASSLQKMKTLDTRTKRSNTISNGLFGSSLNLKSQPSTTTTTTTTSKSNDNNSHNGIDSKVDKITTTTTTTPSTSSSSSTASTTTTNNDMMMNNNSNESTADQPPVAAAATAPKPKPKEDVFTRLSSITKSSRSRSLSVGPSSAPSVQSTNSTSSESHSKDSSKISKIIPKILRSSSKKDVSEKTTTKDNKDATTTTTTTSSSSSSSLKPSKTSPIKSTSTISTLSDSTASISLTSSTSTPTSPTKSLSSYKCTMTPSVALKLYINDLTMAEQSEIMNFPQIFFTGNTTQKTKFNRNLPNNGYDNDQGDYKIVEHDHIAYRYEVLSILGQGSFCQVVKCLDHKTSQLVALKILRNQKRFYTQALTEIKILDFLKNNDPNSSANIVHMNDNFEFRNHLCITFELLSMNLYDFLKNNQFQGFNISLIKRFAAQLLTSLRFLSKRHIIHADLKPENILLKQPTKSGIKLIDFGSSCFENEQIFTYIQSRYYRSPEVILGIKYDKAIDIWSLGCILAELYMGTPLFPGNDEPEQLACIIEIFGVPPPEIINASTRRNVFFYDNGEPKPVSCLNSEGQEYGISTKTLAQSMRTDDLDFIDFIEQCLKWEPSKRLTPEEGLRHKWISELTSVPTATTTPSTTTTTTTSTNNKEES
ncbi:putative protein serine/threonine kinase [Heterostelium album PN500]|uniref:dual-specificity kinase n=1 Tax=Heterostelium pallidum (strain ATCC 26659 / Pp 5 / PN500) TaxID=670386 RepID=D3B6H6_HETP5|nr:putative protein serine/threonine kinase [Heterostelium album PN500]EFA82946.1 putative protein serine/threonine kinase [Heterostelium album PN500]|eukprot:XP_020435063.1 putative protein serine/threonine kinase [Heterostelium album PN500]